VSASRRRSSGSQVVRFLGVGGANSLVTGCIFLVMSYLIQPTLAYTIAFGLGILFSVSVTPRLVFRDRASVGKRAAYAVWYLVVYVIGLGIVYVLHERLGLERWLVVAVTAAGTAGLSYLGARYLFVPVGVSGSSVKT
jgi:putative flippase GtrA